MHRNRLIYSFAMASTALAASFPTLAHAQDLTREEAMAILEEARQARKEAQQALDQANAALQAAERLLRSSGGLVQQREVETPSYGLTKSDVEAGPAGLRDNLCEGVAEAGIASRILQARGKGEDRSKDGLNWFTQQCLGMKTWRDYTDVKALDLKATASSADGVVEAGIGYTSRSMGRSDGEDTDPSYFTSYRTIRPAVFVSTADATDAALFDLDKFQFESGVGIKLGIEWGRHASTKRSELVKSINASLATARASCIASKAVVDPLAPLSKGESEAARPSELSLRSSGEVIQQCSGANLLSWLRKDASGAWASIVKPVWGYDGKPVIFGGLEASYAWSETSYYPLRDTNTGQLLGNDLPAGFLAQEGDAKQETNPFALSGYLGGTWPVDVPFLSGTDGTFGWSGSITYRRSFEVPKALKDQTVCVEVTGATFDQCRAVNIAAPYEREGFVIATAMKFQLPRVAFLPETGFTIKPSYSFDTKQAGVEVPIFFLADSEGKLNGGIKFTCIDDGKTEGGFEIKGECGAALFFGSKFSLGGAP